MIKLESDRKSGETEDGGGAPQFSPSKKMLENFMILCF